MYNKLFTLSDLFNNKELKNYLPQVSIHNIKNKDGTITQKVKGFKIMEEQAINFAKQGARISMSNVKASGTLDNIVVSGRLRKHATIYEAYENVLSILKANKGSLTLLGSYRDVLTNTFQKIQDKSKYSHYKEPKLYLRINSLNEIKYMNKQQKDAFINNIVENIYFSDDFKEYREPSMERNAFIVNKRNTLRGYDSLKRDFDRKVAR